MPRCIHLFPVYCRLPFRLQILRFYSLFTNMIFLLTLLVSFLAFLLWVYEAHLALTLYREYLAAINFNNYHHCFHEDVSNLCALYAFLLCVCVCTNRKNSKHSSALQYTYALLIFNQTSSPALIFKKDTQLTAGPQMFGSSSAIKITMMVHTSLNVTLFKFMFYNNTFQFHDYLDLCLICG